MADPAESIQLATSEPYFVADSAESIQLAIYEPHFLADSAESIQLATFEPRFVADPAESIWPTLMSGEGAGRKITINGKECEIYLWKSRKFHYLRKVLRVSVRVGQE